MLGEILFGEAVIAKTKKARPASRAEHQIIFVLEKRIA